MTTYAKPIPAITRDLAPFFEAAKQHRLVVQKCTQCGHLRFPPRTICSNCLAQKAEWSEVSGVGEVFSFNVMHQIYHPGFAPEAPYAVVLVKLKEGAKMISNLTGVAPKDIKIGMPVKAVFEEVSADVTLPKFAPA